MALDPNYGVRIQEQGRNLLPQAYEPAPAIPTMPQPVTPAAAGGADPTTAGQPKGFPALVLETQGSGTKLTAEQLQQLKDRYKAEVHGPREWAKKGATKGSVEAQQAAFDSKADRWIADYLKQAEGNAASGDAPPDADRGVIKGTAQGLWDTFVSAVKGATTDTAAGIVDLTDYGIRLRNGIIGAGVGLKNGYSASEGFSAGRQMDDVGLKALGIDPRRISDTLTKFGDETADALTSEQTLVARAGLEKLMQNNASAGEIAAYIATNPSAATGMLGETIGFIAPALATGGASAAVKGSALAGRLANSSSRVARLAGKALESAPAIAASSTAPTGGAVGDLRRNIDAMPINALLDSPVNQALYDSLKDFGLTGSTLDRRFRDALFDRAQDATLAGAAAANIVIPGVLGAPAERALAGIATDTGKNVLSRAGRTGFAEGVQEGIASVPDTVAGNISANQVAGNDNIPLTQGLGANAALGVGLGAIVGGGAGAMNAPRNPLVAAAPAAAAAGGCS